MRERNIGHVGDQERLLRGNGLLTENWRNSRQRIRKSHLRQIEGPL